MGRGFYMPREEFAPYHLAEARGTGQKPTQNNMGREGVEPSTLSGYGPKPYAYSNSATCPNIYPPHFQVITQVLPACPVVPALAGYFGVPPPRQILLGVLAPYNPSKTRIYTGFPSFTTST